VAFSLAWEAFIEGSIAVGAVLCDGAGDIVSRGRNRRYSGEAVPGQLSGSGIAHAEINTLATLPSGSYPAHVLYTTLEPCLLRTAALRMSKVGTVCFAAADPLWHSVDRLTREVGHRARAAEATARLAGATSGTVRQNSR
jgi:tRNA(Arg) A34 adenosine deaminase TadA